MFKEPVALKIHTFIYESQAKRFKPRRSWWYHGAFSHCVTLASEVTFLSLISHPGISGKQKLLPHADRGSAEHRLTSAALREIQLQAQASSLSFFISLGQVTMSQLLQLFPTLCLLRLFSVHCRK